MYHNISTELKIVSFSPSVTAVCISSKFGADFSLVHQVNDLIILKYWGSVSRIYHDKKVNMWPYLGEAGLRKIVQLQTISKSLSFSNIGNAFNSFKFRPFGIIYGTTASSFKIFAINCLPTKLPTKVDEADIRKSEPVPQLIFTVNIFDHF